jgi:hypothetical protein
MPLFVANYKLPLISCRTLMNNQIFALTIALAAITLVMTAPTLSNIYGQEEGAKPTTSKCKTSIQVKATGTTNGTEYTATVLEKSITKIADSDTLAFKFSFGKDKKEKVVDEEATTQDAKKPKPPTVPGICPAPGSTITGNVNDVQFETTIPAKGKATVSVDVSSEEPIPEPEPEEPPANFTATQ